MSYLVLTATPTGLHASGYRKLALIHYTGALDHKRLRICERYKGLRIVKVGEYSSRGRNSAAARRLAEWTAEAESLNNGSMRE